MFDICGYYKMIATINLVNMRHHTQLQFFSFWWELWRSSNFQICNTALWTRVPALYTLALSWITFKRSWVVSSLFVGSHHLTQMTPWQRGGPRGWVWEVGASRGVAGRMEVVESRGDPGWAAGSDAASRHDFCPALWSPQLLPTFCSCPLKEGLLPPRGGCVFTLSAGQRSDLEEMATAEVYLDTQLTQKPQGNLDAARKPWPWQIGSTCICWGQTLL